MKYTIEGFNQEEVLKLCYPFKEIMIDVIDLVILRWIVDFEPKMTKKIIDDETYFWVNYQSLLDALPILNIKKRMLCYRLEKMCNVGILEHKNIKDKGNYSYYSFGQKYINLVQNIAEPFAINCLTLKQNIAEQNNSSIKETHLLNNSKENIKEMQPSIDNSKEIYFNNDELNDLFLEYLELRKSLKAKNTERAIKLLINDLKKYDDAIKIRMLENSIKNSWKSVYEIKDIAKPKERNYL